MLQRLHESGAAGEELYAVRLPEGAASDGGHAEHRPAKQGGHAVRDSTRHIAIVAAGRTVVTCRRPWDACRLSRKCPRGRSGERPGGRHFLASSGTIACKTSDTAVITR